MINFQKIESKWQNKWESKKAFQAKKSKKKKFYCLEMYPYPSGEGLHMGHVCNYVIGDVYTRFKRMNNFNVLYPMGYDSFGLPAENAAIKHKTHPKIYTEKAIKNFIKQQKQMGLSYDWSRTLASHKEDYYKWDQWIFLQLYKKGLAYKKKAAVNWCPECKTVLANEQVINGKCWRHTSTEVEIKELNQWFFKITDYAEQLLNGLNKLSWPEEIKTIQRNWIGQSSGTLINFRLKDTNENLPVFTTRIDTIYGVTFLVFAPEHPKVLELVKGTKYESKVKEFIKKVIIKDKFTRTSEETEKEGLFIGKYAINPLTNEEIPIYIGNFVLLEYGYGLVMAVPAHDQRDFEFAKKYNILIKIVITPKHKTLNELHQAYIEDGILINSKQFNGLDNKKAIEEITKYLNKTKLGNYSTQYKLRDWLISRQRYWGCPIPIIYCDNCGIVPVPEKNLPVKLPEKVQFGKEGNPLATNKQFVNVKCPKCKGKALRETDTMDTFIDSSWYFFRYCDNKNKKKLFDSSKVNYWMPIDTYIGGKEHATGHLLYCRFMTKFFKDLKLTKFDEPILKLFNQGMLHKDNVVMSKSKGNIVTQEEIAKKYGIDTARFFLMFIASPDKDKEWSTTGIESSYKSIFKIYNLLNEKQVKNTPELENKINKTIKEVTYEIENFNYNIALIKIMDYVSYLYKKGCTKYSLEVLAKLIAPLTPHLAEELWNKLNHKTLISLETWPKYDAKKINEKYEMQDLFIEQTKKDIYNIINLVNIKPKKIKIFISESWKYDLFKKIKKEIELTRNPGEIIKKVMDKVHGKEIAQIVNSIVKDPSKIPEVILDQKTELLILKQANFKEFNAEIDIILAENSTENKAKNSIPGKVAILVE